MIQTIGIFEDQDVVRMRTNNSSFSFSIFQTVMSHENVKGPSVDYGG